MEQHWIWSDGCAGKFKNSHVFQWLCILHKRHKVPHIWNYFETRHGKWEHDGAGACMKTALRRKGMKFTTISLIRDAKTIVAWCSLVMGQGASVNVIVTSECIHLYFLCIVPRCLFQDVSVMYLSNVMPGCSYKEVL